MKPLHCLLAATLATTWCAAFPQDVSLPPIFSDFKVPLSFPNLASRWQGFQRTSGFGISPINELSYSPLREFEYPPVNGFNGFAELPEANARSLNLQQRKFQDEVQPELNPESFNAQNTESAVQVNSENILVPFGAPQHSRIPETIPDFSNHNFNNFPVPYAPEYMEFLGSGTPRFPFSYIPEFPVPAPPPSPAIPNFPVGIPEHLTPKEFPLNIIPGFQVSNTHEFQSDAVQRFPAQKVDEFSQSVPSNVPAFPFWNFPGFQNVPIVHASAFGLSFPEDPEFAVPNVPGFTSPRESGFPFAYAPGINSMNIPEVSAPRIPEFLVPNVPGFNLPNAPEYLVPNVPNVPNFEIPNSPEIRSPMIPEVMAPAVPNAPDYNGPSVPKFAVPNALDFNGPAVPNFAVPNVPDFNGPAVPNFAVPNALDFNGPAVPNFAVPNAPDFNGPAVPNFAVPNALDFNGPSVPNFAVPNAHDFNGPSVPNFAVPNAPDFNGPAVPNFVVPNALDFNGPAVPNFVVPNALDFNGPAVPNFAVPNALDFNGPAVPNFAVPNALDFNGPAVPNFAVPNALDFNGPAVPNFVGEEINPLEQLPLLDLEPQKTHDAPLTRYPLVTPFSFNSFDSNEGVPINPFVNNNNQLPLTAMNPFMINIQSRDPFMINNQSPDLFMADNQSPNPFMTNSQSPQILDTFAPPINPFVFQKMQGSSPVYRGRQIFNNVPFQPQSANGYETDYSEPQLMNGPVHGYDIVNPHASEASEAPGLHHAVAGRELDTSNQEMFNEEIEKFQDYNPVPVTAPFTQMEVVQGPHYLLDFDGSYNALDQPVPLFY